MNDITIQINREAAMNWLSKTNLYILQDITDLRGQTKKPEATMSFVYAVSFMRNEIERELEKQPATPEKEEK